MKKYVINYIDMLQGSEFIPEMSFDVMREKNMKVSI
jgi:hypothetical protein